MSGMSPWNGPWAVFEASSTRSIATRTPTYERANSSTPRNTSWAVTPTTINGRRRPQGLVSWSLAAPAIGWTTMETTAWREAMRARALVLTAAGTSCSTSLGRTIVVTLPHSTDRPSQYAVSVASRRDTSRRSREPASTGEGSTGQR